MQEDKQEDKVITDVISKETLNKQVDSNIQDIIESVAYTENTDEMKRLIQMFNQNIIKKNMIRVLMLYGILDKATQEVFDRFYSNPNAIADKNIVAYIKTIQDIIDKSTNSTSNISELQPINMTQTNVTINNNAPELSADSRQKILDAVKAIQELTNNQKDNQESVDDN